jgi:methionyl aminopeptidase
VIHLKNKKDIIILQEGGKRLAKVMKVLRREAKLGVSAAFLDEIAYKMIKKYGGYPSFLNYQADFANRLFPNSLCVSLNDTIVHGIPRKEIILKPGDIVSLDIGMEYKGLFTDMAITFGLDKIKLDEKRLIKTTQNALAAAIKVARPGNTLGDIGYAIENCATKNGSVVIRDLVGHGVGYAVHEDPPVFNYGEKGKGMKIEAGLVIAIEPMLTYDNGAVKENSDGSFATLNGKKACHFEHTVVITQKGPLVLTK